MLIAAPPCHTLFIRSGMTADMPLLTELPPMSRSVKFPA
jgi:hypothetical protein